ncbi:MAG: lysylphosphatidylglycerol synthase transmembrane domain-containing protein [Phycisphaerales bacterium]|nr:lysylphosphatidylglycerol synthase transmembrane domain-containing protein [Phycisphaerales bacterium]
MYQKKITQLLQYFFFISLGISLIFWSLNKIPPSEWKTFVNSLQGAHFTLFIPICILLFISNVVRAARWKLLIKPLGYNPKFWNTFFAVSLGYMANLAVPRLGEVLKCTVLSKYEKIPPDKIVGTILSERLVDVLCLALIFIFIFFYSNNYFQSIVHEVNLIRQSSAESQSNSSDKWVYGVFLLVIVIGIYWTLKKGIINSFNTLKNLFIGLLTGFFTIFHLDKKITFIVYSFIIWGCYFLSTYIGFKAMDQTANIGPMITLNALAFGAIGMILTPGGIGAYPSLIEVVLRPLGISYAIGLANGTLQWFGQTFYIITAGFCTLILLPFFNKKNTVTYD